jgi:hypothetical protein
MKLHIQQLSPVSYYFSPLRTKYLPEHRQTMPSPKYQGPVINAYNENVLATKTATVERPQAWPPNILTVTHYPILNSLWRFRLLQSYVIWTWIQTYPWTSTTNTLN